MKFVIATQEFNFLLNKCLNVVPNKPTIPILSNLLIEAHHNNEVVITATDLTVGIRCKTEAKVLQPGSTTIPAKRLSQLLRELTSVNCEVSANANDILEIIADSSRFKLHGMSRSEFPSLPDMSGATRLQVKQKDLKDALFRTAFAVSRDDTRFVLTGVYMSIANGEAKFVGTDGKRLAKTRIQVDIDCAFTGSYIIPLKAVDEILKSLTEDGDATILLMYDKIAIEAGHTMMITKLLSGEYPDVNRVIPMHSSLSIALHREELMTLLRQVSLFIADTGHSVRFAFSNGELKLSANTMEIGEGKVSMPANYHGQMLEIAFNPNFFLDILRHTKQETVLLGVSDAYNPGVITDAQQPVNPAEARSLFVLMPMRLNEE